MERRGSNGHGSKPQRGDVTMLHDMSSPSMDIPLRLPFIRTTPTLSSRPKRHGLIVTRSGETCSLLTQAIVLVSQVTDLAAYPCISLYSPSDAEAGASTPFGCSHECKPQWGDIYQPKVEAAGERFCSPCRRSPGLRAKRRR